MQTLLILIIRRAVIMIAARHRSLPTIILIDRQVIIMGIKRRATISSALRRQDMHMIQQRHDLRQLRGRRHQITEERTCHSLQERARLSSPSIASLWRGRSRPRHCRRIHRPVTRHPTTITKRWTNRHTICHHRHILLP